MLRRKRMKTDMESYHTAQKLLKNNRESQKSFSYYKKQQSINKALERKSSKSKDKTVSEGYNKEKNNHPIIVIRLVGLQERITKPLLELLKKYRLLKIYSCVVLSYSKQVYEDLCLLNSYVTWGYGNKTSISLLVNKRGNVYNAGTKTLSELENNEIEKVLGKDNVLCIEDVVYELSSKLSANRNKVMSYLGFFLLSPCEETKDNALVPYYKGGNTGFRAEEINSLVKKMI